MISVKTATKCKPRGKPSESKAMGLCLEAEHEPAAVQLLIESDLYGRGKPKKSLNLLSQTPSPLRAHPAAKGSV
jgi:hypothetical protein